MKHAALPLIMILALVGCVTGKSETPDAAGSEVADSPETAGVEPVTKEDQADWQSTLSEDLDAVEKLGQSFLESSFALYDKLLKEDITEKDTDVARDAVDDCRGKYNQLVTAIGRLNTSLARPDVREALPLAIDGNKEELAELLKAFSVYQPATFGRDDFTVGEGRYLTSMMFPGMPEEMPDYMNSLPKANRDALLLLDHLKRISGDLSSLSSTLTAWIYDSASFDADAFVH